MTEEVVEQPSLAVADEPLSLIPVGLKEAAIDSPSFRATVVHYCEQIDCIEKWLDGFAKSASRLAQQIVALEGVVQPFLASARPPLNLSEAILDHDYTLLAVNNYGQAAREFWTHAIGGFKKTQYSIIDPIKAFLLSEFRAFKDARKHLETSQRNYDSLLVRYYGQSKTKEPSSLREDAWQLHEAKKLYLKASLDFCIAVPHLRTSLDTLLIRVFSDHWLEMKDLRETETAIFSAHTKEILRIRAWSKTLNESDKFFSRELLATRKDLEERVEISVRPSRDLDEYSILPAQNLRTPAIRPSGLKTLPSSKQGWLFLRTVSGKPARTYWTRRYCFVGSGVFGWLTQSPRSGGIEESEKVGVLLCNVRLATTEDRRFCFEIKTKDLSLVLQAESQADLQLWLSVFETAKQKALEAPRASETSEIKTSTSFDAAFAITPAIAPELAAKLADGRIATINEEASAMHQAGEHDSTGPRPSIDMASTQNSGLDRAIDGHRDQGPKIIQKLDIHRKSVSTQASPTTANAAATLSAQSGSGFASLINATYNATYHALPAFSKALSSQDGSLFEPTAETAGALAPNTLAQVPNLTNLSRTALVISAEKGVDLGTIDRSGGIPGSLMANQWGSANYGHMARLERDQILRNRERASSAPVLSRPTTPLGLASTQRKTSDASHGATTGEEQPHPDTVSSHYVAGRKDGHRRTISDVDGMPHGKVLPTSSNTFPEFYPQNLILQDTQLRMFFPNVPKTDRVVMVFRGTWRVDDLHNLPGRVFATQKELYFYSNHMGFVLVSGISLTRIVDVSMDPGKQQDVLCLRVAGATGQDEYSTVTVKSYLEPVGLLHRRLSLLVSNAKLDEPAPLKDLLQTLISMRPEVRAYSPTSKSGPSSKYRVYPRLSVDRRLFGGDSASFHDSGDASKIKLPTQPVTYAPTDMTRLAAEAVVDVSAKALFHIMFGDKSVLSEMLYFHRRTNVITKHPWTSIDQSHWARNFDYHVDAGKNHGQTQRVLIIDSQTVDVANEHLCYVVTDKKCPWHLPNPKDFSLVTKIVITHFAKSKAKLAVYIKVGWLQDANLLRRAIEQHALHDLQLDADDIVSLVIDQVTKLGAKCPTKRAIFVFGQIGKETEVKQINAPDSSVTGPNKYSYVQPQSTVILAGEMVFSLAVSAASTIVMAIIASLRLAGKPFTTHRFLTILLSISLFTQFLSSTALVRNWWAERTTARFMANLGIGPNTVMGKTMYLHDLYEEIGISPTSLNSTNQCKTTFHHLLSQSDPSAPLLNYLMSRNLEHYDHFPDGRRPSTSTARTALRLYHTRQRLGKFRHDLLVSLRLLNNIERDTIGAQYEVFVLNEDERCRRVGTLLSEAERDDKNAAKNDLSPTSASESFDDQGNAAANTLMRKRLDEVKGWWQTYCSDCRIEAEAIDLSMERPGGIAWQD